MSMDAITRMMNSFKHFEKKLDKLQDDVNYQGQTLLDLRVMMMNLSAGNIAGADAKSDDVKRQRIKTESMQYEEKIQHSPATDKPTRPIGLKSMPVKKTPSQKRRLFSEDRTSENLVRRMEASQLHVQRHRKIEAARKGNAARLYKKKSDKKKPTKMIVD